MTDFEERNAGLVANAQRARDATAEPGNRYKVLSELVEFESDGAIVVGTVWRPDDGNASGSSRGAVLLCHGWGGIRAHLDSTYARVFAQHGLVALTFDYRSWGDSEPPFNGACGLKLVSPTLQLQDIAAALAFLSTRVAGVDPARIGAWGSSLGGGHVLSLAGQSGSRVAAIVSQVPAARPVELLPDSKARQEHKAALVAKGGPEPFADGPIPTKPEWAGVGIDGRIRLTEMEQYSPLANAEGITCPTLIIDAAEEELFHVPSNGEAVVAKLKAKGVAVEYKICGGKHYGIYDQPNYGVSCKLAADFFVRQLLQQSRL
jgi:dienelactone hydrolase